MLEWIKRLLEKQLDHKKQDVIRLRWQQAQLQKQVEELKHRNSEG